MPARSMTMAPRARVSVHGTPERSGRPIAATGRRGARALPRRPARPPPRDPDRRDREAAITRQPPGRGRTPVRRRGPQPRRRGPRSHRAGRPRADAARAGSTERHRLLSCDRVAGGASCDVDAGLRRCRPRGGGQGRAPAGAAAVRRRRPPAWSPGGTPGIDRRWAAPPARSTSSCGRCPLALAGPLDPGRSASSTCASDVTPVSGAVFDADPAHRPAWTADRRCARRTTAPGPDRRAGRWTTWPACCSPSRDDPDDVFVAAGSPWFLTLFGRDSLWAARMTAAVRHRRWPRHAAGARPPPGHPARPGDRRGSRARSCTSCGARTYADPASAAPAAGLLRHRRRHAAVDQPAARRLALGDAPSRRSRRCCRALERRWLAGDARRRRRRRLPASTSTQSGRGLANQGWKDSGDAMRWRRRADRRAADRAVRGAGRTPTRRRSTAAALLDAFGRRAAAPTAALGRRRWPRRFRAVVLGRGRRRAVPGASALDGDRRPGRPRGQQHRPPARHRAARRAEESARSPTGSAAPDLAAAYGLRTLSALDAGVQPARLPLRLGVAARHRDRASLGLRPRRPRRGGRLAGLAGCWPPAGAFDYRLPELFGGDAAARAGAGALPGRLPAAGLVGGGRRRAALGRARPVAPTCRAAGCGRAGAPAPGAFGALSVRGLRVAGTRCPSRSPPTAP